jgi:hypothetical protein
MALTRQQRARAYIGDSMAASYTSLPGEAREAREARMAEHRRRYPDVVDHALAGSDAMFDRPLTAGEREHQRHMRDQAGLNHGQILEMRKHVKDELAEPPSRARRTGAAARGAARAGARAGRTYIRSEAAPKLSVSSGGSITLQIAGVAIGLSLLYLVLSQGGSRGLSTLLNGVTGTVRGLIEGKDPLLSSGGAASEASQAAKSRGSSVEANPSGQVEGEPPSPTVVKAQRQKLKPNFGPAPGISGPLGLVQGAL